MLFGWVLTILVTALFSAGTTGLALYAPSKPASLDVVYQSQALYNATRAFIYEMNATNLVAGPSFNPDLANQLTVRSSSHLVRSLQCVHAAFFFLCPARSN